MAKKRPELDISRFDALVPGEVSMRVPIFRDCIQMDLMERRETTGRLFVNVEGESAPPSDLICVKLNNGEPIQVRRDMGHPALKRAVDQVKFNRSEDGVWLPDPELEIDNRYAFVQFSNLVVAHALIKQKTFRA